METGRLDNMLPGRRYGTLWRILVCALLLVALALLTAATQDSERFSRLYSVILGINAAALGGLVVATGISLYRLFRARSEDRPGSRVAVRLAGFLVLLAVVPVLVVYLFSMHFLRTGIDSWFDVQVEESLAEALELTRVSLSHYQSPLKEALTGALGRRLAGEHLDAEALEAIRLESGAVSVTRSSLAGRQSTAGALPEGVPPPTPERLAELQAGEAWTSTEPVADGLVVRVLVGLDGGDAAEAFFAIPSEVAERAENVQAAYTRHGELTFLQGALRESFTLTLSLVLLVSLMFAVWLALYLAQRLTAPVRDLEEGTRAVAEGEYGTQLPTGPKDELGGLVASFNEMSRNIARTRESAKRSQAMVEHQRARLETVLERLSSGVITLDAGGGLRSANAAAEAILQIPLRGHMEATLVELQELNQRLAPFWDRMAECRTGDTEWREQMVITGADGNERNLAVSGAQLPGISGPGGHVVVFDDITDLLLAQREAAWGEVARRLAHEIRNPLTPIQLAAERLRHKLHGALEGGNQELLERSTDIIVQQVEIMKSMVNAFAEYARAPRMERSSVDIAGLLEEAAELYRHNVPGVAFQLSIEEPLPVLCGDADRLRRLLHNLLRNASDACTGAGGGTVTVSARPVGRPDRRLVEIAVRDDGPGFDASVLPQAFEPYVTTKPKGTGLGLPIVKKIAEEHDGSIEARNSATGAEVVLRLPGRSNPMEGVA